MSESKEELREEGRKALKYLLPCWVFNALVVIGAWFAYAWAETHHHWSVDAWNGLLVAWCMTKIIVSGLLVVAFLKYISGNRLS
jgi:hypothetical protein